MQVPIEPLLEDVAVPGLSLSLGVPCSRRWLVWLRPQQGNSLCALSVPSADTLKASTALLIATASESPLGSLAMVSLIHTSISVT